MDRFSGLAEFIAAVRGGSLRAAGEQLGITTSGVGKAISRLESRLGVRLLNRTTRSLRPTAEGAALYPRARRLLAELAEMEAEVSKARAQPNGRMRVDLPPALGRLRVLPALPKFLEQWPDLHLQVDLRDRIADLADEGIDAAVRTGEVQGSGLAVRRVGVARFVTCAAPSYLQRSGAPRRPEDLLRHNCLRFAPSQSGLPREWRFGRGTAARRLPVQGNLVLNHTEGLADAAIHGNGVVQVLDFVVADAIRDGQLRPILTEWDSADLPISLVCPLGPHRSANVRAFGDFVTSLFKAPPRHGSSRIRPTSRDVGA